MRVWIDIENPPQVQYLLPLHHAFAKAGAETFITARDYGITFDLLRAAGVEFTPVGTSYGREKWRKLTGLAGRTRDLLRVLRRRPRPDLLVCAGRASLIAARRLHVPAFSIWDYEHSNMTFDRLGGAHVAFPDVIDPSAFLRNGIKQHRLIPFKGLKEDISFAGVDIDSVQPHDFPQLEGRRGVRVLFRPAAEESHYYRDASGDVSHRLLEHLSRQADALVIFSPRYPRQAAEVEGLSWANEPLILHEAVPFVPLLKAVDIVISSGGTMIREAAYLGVPSYSAFRGEPGGVDLFLEREGRLRFVSSDADFSEIRLERGGRRQVLATNPRLAEDLVGSFSAVTSG